METPLTHLQQSFAAWKASSLSKRYSNTALREQAVQCLSHYTHREVSAAISVPVTTLRLWQKSLACHQEKNTTPSEFVALNLDEREGTDETNQESLSLQISLPGGILLKVTSTVASSVAFIVALNKESRSCSI